MSERSKDEGGGGGSQRKGGRSGGRRLRGVYEEGWSEEGGGRTQFPSMGVLPEGGFAHSRYVQTLPRLPPRALLRFFGERSREPAKIGCMPK